MKKDKTQKEETPLKMLELTKKEKLVDLIHGNDMVKVDMPSFAVLYHIVGLRVVFHQDMDSIFRDSSWLDVTNLLATSNQKVKYLAHYLLFGWKTQHWKQDMRQWDNNHKLCVVEKMLEGIKQMLPKKNRLH